MATNFRATFGYIGSFGTVAFLIGLQCHHFNSKISSASILATSFANVIKIGTVTSENMRVTSAPF